MAELGAIGYGLQGNGVAKFPIPSASRGAVFGVTCSRNLVPKNADSAQFNKAIPGITKQFSAPVAGVLVRLYDRESGVLLAERVSGASGEFSFPNLSDSADYFSLAFNSPENLLGLDILTPA